MFVPGDGSELRFPTEDYFSFYREFKWSFLAFQKRWRSDAMPDPGLDRSWARWSQAAEPGLEARDHLSRVADIRQTQVAAQGRGIARLRALAASDGLPVPPTGTPTLERLQLCGD